MPVESYTSAIRHLELTPRLYNSLMRSPYVGEEIGGEDGVALVIVRGSAPQIADPGSVPVVVCWIGDQFGGDGPTNADLVLDQQHIEAAVSCIARAPIAASSLAVLLRGIARSTVTDGLAMESAAYSMLQAGPEFATWRATAQHIPEVDVGPVVAVERDGDKLLLTLDRPRRHNAISTQLRDELDAALAIAEADNSLTSIVLSGNGPSFCSGGDLAEFGLRSDPATAHVTRLARSPARRIHRLRDRLSAHLHGAAFGGGIELAAFAGHVVAHPDTLIALPEIGLGLIPGAGGTVSLTRRMGRQRTAALALTAKSLDALTALDWHLVDELDKHVATFGGSQNGL